jgi:hypothetical protein
MKFIAETLIEDLINSCRLHLKRVDLLSELPAEQLNYKLNADKWSVLECIEHLNLYSAYYLPAIENSITKSTHPATTEFKSGLIGNYFAKSMAPKAKLNKMKSPSDKNPNNSELNMSIMTTFIVQQNELITLLESAKVVSLTKTKTPISISTILKLRLGDTFRFVSAHNDRHLLQAENVIRSFKG